MAEFGSNKGQVHAVMLRVLDERLSVCVCVRVCACQFVVWLLLLLLLLLCV